MKLGSALIILAIAVMAILLFLPADIRAAPLTGLDDTRLEGSMAPGT